jgi:hypothetical protein
MEKKTFKVIIILVGLLFINIEAAHAGLINKFKMFIKAEFPDYQLIYSIIAFSILAFLSYVVFSPIQIGVQKWSWINYYTYNPSRNSYNSKKQIITKISGILKNE